MAETWEVKGTVVLACNCDFGCPCNFNARPTTGDCEGTWAWHVESGRYGDVRLDGLTFTLAGDWPGAIHEGNGEAAIFLDERADDDQRRALETLVRGEAGGPWGILANTFSTVHGPTFVPYDVELAGARSAVRGGDAVEIATEPVRNPVTGVEVHPRVELPQGFVFKEAALLASRSYRVRDGVEYDHSGKYAAVAPFEYAGP